MNTITSFFTSIVIFFTGLFGGVSDTKPAVVNPPVVISGAEVTDIASSSNKGEVTSWNTYINKEKGYQIKYPSDSKIDASNTSCVQIDTKEFGSVYINGGSSDPCGVPTGVSNSSVNVTSTVKLESKEYNFSGRQNNNNAYSFFASDISNKLSVVYGVEHRSVSGVNPEELGSLTPDQHQKALDSAKSILMTLTFTAIDTKQMMSNKVEVLPACKNEVDGMPVITSLSSTSGPVGTVLKVLGCNLTGFEGDRDLTFISSEGIRFTLKDATGDFRETKGTQITVTIKEPCQKGDLIYDDYSGIQSVCNSPKMTTGVYKVYTAPWNKKSNVVTFTVIP